jgi:hypothetical protein
MFLYACTQVMFYWYSRRCSNGILWMSKLPETFHGTRNKLYVNLSSYTPSLRLSIRRRAWWLMIMSLSFPYIIQSIRIFQSFNILCIKMFVRKTVNFFMENWKTKLHFILQGPEGRPGLDGIQGRVGDPVSHFHQNLFRNCYGTNTHQKKLPCPSTIHIDITMMLY